MRYNCHRTIKNKNKKEGGILPKLLSGKESDSPCRRPGLERSPGGGNGNSSILAWEIPCTEEPGGLQPMGLQRVRHN